MKTFALFFIFLLGISQNAQGSMPRCIELTHTDGLKKNICDKYNNGFLILEFVKPACHACRLNVEKFKQLEDRNKLVAHSRIISFGNLDTTLRFAQSYNITTDIAVDNLLEASIPFNIREVPAIVVLDNANNIIYQKTGILSDNDINLISDIIMATKTRVCHK